MPIYVYVTCPEKETEVPERFEVVQSMSEPALTHHPVTGDPVRRVIAAPVVLRNTSIGKDVMGDQNLKRNGFSRYEKTGDGVYERTAGKEGPKRITRDGKALS